MVTAPVRDSDVWTRNVSRLTVLAGTRLQACLLRDTAASTAASMAVVNDVANRIGVVPIRAIDR